MVKPAIPKKPRVVGKEKTNSMDHLDPSTRLLIQTLQKQAADAKADADKRVAEAKAEAKADADKRVADAKAYADKRVADAKAEGDKRAADAKELAKFAIAKAMALRTDSTPRLEEAKSALLKSQTITWGCRGRLTIKRDEITKGTSTYKRNEASFDFAEGGMRDVAIKLEVPIEEYIKRDVQSVKPITKFKALADASALKETSIKNAKMFWRESKRKSKKREFEEADEIDFTQVLGKRYRCK